jgi:hypothetical protein
MAMRIWQAEFAKPNRIFNFDVQRQNVPSNRAFGSTAATLKFQSEIHHDADEFVPSGSS